MLELSIDKMIQMGFEGPRITYLGKACFIGLNRWASES